MCCSLNLPFVRASPPQSCLGSYTKNTSGEHTVLRMADTSNRAMLQGILMPSLQLSSEDCTSSKSFLTVNPDPCIDMIDLICLTCLSEAEVYTDYIISSAGMQEHRQDESLGSDGFCSVLISGINYCCKVFYPNLDKPHRFRIRGLRPV